MTDDKKPSNIRCCDCKFFSLGGEGPACEAPRPWWVEPHEHRQFGADRDVLIRHSCDVYEEAAHDVK